MNLIYLVFGERFQNHLQAAFSILSHLAQREQLKRIIIVTDYADYYNFFEDQVEIFPINDQILRKWKGKHDYFWRVKIKAVQAIQQQYPGEHLLYLDSDTFLHGDLQLITQELDKGNCLMHLNEGVLAQSKYKTGKGMWKVLKHQRFNGVLVDEQVCMWNAGLIALDANNAKAYVEKALGICDALCETSVKPWLIEQFSFSLALQDSKKIKAGEAAIAHYWSNKEAWNHFFAEFFAQSRLLNQDLEACIEYFKNQDLSQLPVKVKQSSTEGKIKKKVSSLFAHKRHVEFIPKA